LQGSLVLEEKYGIQLISSFHTVAHVPGYLQTERIKTNWIDDWETKIDAIVEETYNERAKGLKRFPRILGYKCILPPPAKNEESR
jgi:hypothetical protein